jgi:DNA-directed RNA polymerase specialized sigma24 family protein
VTRWLGDLKTGGDAAAQHLWERYFQRLVHLARQKLQAARERRAVEDEEDAALSAFDSFCRGVARGRFPRLTDRDDLWRILIVITVRKAYDQIARGNALARGGDKEGVGGAGLDFVPGNEPTPELAAMVVDEYRRLRNALRDDALRQVLDLRLEGHKRREIADRMGLSHAAVARKLALIRNGCLERDGR